MARLIAELLPRWLPARDSCSHKGDNGRLLIVGGDHGFAGAIHMTGGSRAALRRLAGPRADPQGEYPPAVNSPAEAYGSATDP